MRFKVRVNQWLLAAMIAGVSACAPSAMTAGNVVPQNAPDGFAVIDSGNGLKEVTFLGRKFVDRDQVEGHLLYRAAVLTKESGYKTFVFRHLPGEGGPNVHPPRRSSSLGAIYGHWQPHWNYYVKGVGWQPWHPEWAVRFWAEEAPLDRVERFEAHAMIQMQNVSSPSDESLKFDAQQVIRDLERGFRRSPT